MKNKKKPKTLKPKLITATATAYVISKYLQELCSKIGKEEYLKSPVRLQHGPGTGGFGFKGIGKPIKRLGGTGNNDCVKERFRGITDGLDLTFRTIDKIKFRTSSCITLTERNRDDHRIEHTEELIDLFLEFEQEYIITNKPFTANDLARFVLERTLVCLIEQKEQKSGDLLKDTYDPTFPFSKYTNPVFCEGQDVSGLTKSELQAITARQYADVFKKVSEYDWSEKVAVKETELINSGGDHSLPPMEIAVQYYNDAFSLLKYYYNYQLRQLTDPAEKILYYNEEVAKLYKEWNEKLQMA